MSIQRDVKIIHASVNQENYEPVFKYGDKIVDIKKYIELTTPFNTVGLKIWEKMMKSYIHLINFADKKKGIKIYKIFLKFIGMDQRWKQVYYSIEDVMLIQVEKERQRTRFSLDDWDEIVKYIEIITEKSPYCRYITTKNHTCKKKHNSRSKNKYCSLHESFYKKRYTNIDNSVKFLPTVLTELIANYL